MGGSIFFCLAFLFVLFFFRDPEREVIPDPRVILAPADGRVVHVGDFFDERFLKGEAKKVDVFMSLFNVHINRIPMSGTVRLLQYLPGSFYSAFRPQASERNEQMLIGIQNGETRVLLKQVAGVMARRIVCRLQEGEGVYQGERFGMIKFGSRVEVILPKSTILRVKVGDRTKGGETILGEL